MSDPAQLYQKLLNDAIHKLKTILGPDITLIKTRTVAGLTVTDTGEVATLGDNPEQVVTSFLEEFRTLSSPLVKKTMQPLLSAIGPMPVSNPPSENAAHPDTGKSETQKV